MHKAFIITGTRDGKEVNGVFFTDTDPVPALIHGLGIENIEIFQVAPKSDQPVSPTLYLFQPGSNEVEIIGFDWQHKEVAKTTAAGIPYHLIPPVQGEKAEQTLYAPTAHLIKGTMDGTHVLGILVIKPEAGKVSLEPNSKTLKAMGISISTIERVKCEQNGVKATQLFIVERSPSARSVTVKTLSEEGNFEEETRKGDPQQLLPCVKGSQIERLFKNGLSSIPPASCIPPSKPGHSNRPKRRKRRSR